MAEPFSLASGAVGVISLGLQLCQQLVTYCQSYKNFDEDIRNIFDKASGLRCPLEVLHKMIDDTQITNPDIARDIEQKLFGLRKAVDHLQKSVDRYKPSLISDRFPDRMQQQLNKVAYPFRKDILRDMVQDLDSLQIFIQTTLQIYSVQQMMDFGSVQEKLLREVQQIRLTLQDSPCKLIPPPALMQTWGIVLNDYTQSVRTKQQLATYSAANVEKPIGRFSESGYRSLPQTRYRAKSAVKSFKYLSSLFRVAINLSFSLSIGAGAFSISPSLRFQFVSDLGSSLPWLIRQQLFNDRASNKSCALIFENSVDDCIYQLQQAFTDGKATPSDAYYSEFDDTRVISIVDALVPWSLVRWRDELPSLRRLTKFLIECGSMPNNTQRFGVLQGFISDVLLGEQDLSLVIDLVDLGGPLLLPDSPLNNIAKRNFKYIISEDEALVSFPDNAMIVFRESQEELQRALELGKISPNNIFDGSQSLLQLAFGWPQGVKILLHSGVDANKLTTMLLSSPTRYIDDMDVDFDAYYESTRLVLEAGCMLTVCDIDRFTSRKLQSLLAHELAKRRWKLWELSKSHFPNNEQLDLDARRDAVPDIQAARICKAFAAQGRTIDPQLLVGELTPSVYHECSLYTETMEELFEAGFRDVNSASSSGVTPLMVTRSLGIGSKHKLIRRAAWLISKGADAHRKLPRSNATVAHLLSAEMTGILLSLTLHGSFQSGGLAQWQFWEERISPHKFNVFPVPSVRDDCFCACCPSGCTVLSVALRQICRWAWWPYVSNRSFVFQRLLHMLIDYTQSSPSVSQTLIRCLTFDAIGLRHTCCIEIEDEETAEDMEGREERELLEILEEDERELEDLKGLISEFERKFDDLGLPIWEFLETYWHKRVVEYLLKQDPYDEEHNRAVNAIGIDLQVEEEVPLDRVSLLIGDPYDEKQERKAKVIDSKAGKELIPDPISLLLHARNLKKR